MTAVEQLLEQIREVATDEHDKGDRFERLMLHGFRTDRTFQQQFAQVWRWMDWPDRDSRDIGIDLVARTAEGLLIAIQCKCYSSNDSIDKRDIDSFLATSAQGKWSRRIVVATTDLWSANAEKTIEGQPVPVERIGIDDLEAMTVDWSSYDVDNPTGLKPTARKVLHPYQIRAVDDVRKGFKASDRGKLIMACGTGKTFTALRIAEEHAGPGGAVLFLAPSIALIDQALKEWTAECEVPVRPFAVCSDVTTGKALDGENAAPFDLVIPPATDPVALVEARVHELPGDLLTVVFSTYQSIEVVAEMQKKTGLVFDLIVCDEAHRTAGVASVHDEDRVFGLVHDNDVVPAHKRLYMTATPKLFKPLAVDAAKDDDAVLASMDNPAFFGEEFHRLGFGEAVEEGLLADYRVLILTVDERAVSASFQGLLSSAGELSLPDVARFVGCLSGLAKLPGVTGVEFAGDERPMRRAVAFWSTIADSARFAQQFEQVAEAYFDQVEAGRAGDEVAPLEVPTRHVDGTLKMSSRRTDLRWLAGEPGEGECRILTNAKCLTEGVDVPALDAVMFLAPRRSKIDIVQAVGRVMRKPPGKQLGYVILPVAIPAGVDPAIALNKNPDYDVVWEVLQALRAHDERFNAYINRIDLGSTKPGTDPDDKIKVIPVDLGEDPTEPDVQSRLFEYEEWTSAIYTKIVQKVGSRTYWEDWARDVAAIAGRHETRIATILEQQQGASDAFNEFLDELRATLNDAITHRDAIAMVSQHIITRPIFEALFGDDLFAEANPVSVAMTNIADVLDQNNLDTETGQLEDFFASIRRRVEGIHPDDGEARQKIIKDLYGRFFKLAFPKVAESLGIVYTPIEVVDFIIRATEAALAHHFGGVSLSAAGVHVLDPFTGTGSFITRLLQSGFIRPEDLERKFTDELHANEILLLAYYIAAVNIETTYRQVVARAAGTDPGYAPFPGVVLTDTFQLGESDEGTGSWDVFPINNARATRQRGLDIRVILGNPPYSVGQESANDANANLKYPRLDESIKVTYAARSTASNKNKLYDSYIRAIRWASNRVIASAHGGVVAFVTNGGYVDSNSLDGLRLALANEFHHMYVFNLRGNQRTAGEVSRREGGKIFDSGSRAAVAIMLLIKEPGDVPGTGAALRYLEVDDYLSRDEKLQLLASAFQPRESGAPILADLDWVALQPNKHGDWINQRSESFAEHLPMASADTASFFELRSLGLATGRDAWNYNSSRSALDANAASMIDAYNAAADAYDATGPSSAGALAERAKRVASEIGTDPRRFSWNRNAFTDVARGTRYSADDPLVTEALYRPFHRRWAETSRRLNAMVYQLPRVFPPGGENLAILVPTEGSRAPFSVLITSCLPDLHVWPDGTICFPRFVYDTAEPSGSAAQLFGSSAAVSDRRHNVTDDALALYRSLDSAIEKDDLYFYVYGILHSPDYRDAYGADLRKTLPRIPQVPTASEFWAFANAGRELATLHTDYESVEPWPDLELRCSRAFDAKHPDAYRVLKMRHPKVPDPTDTKAKIEDRSQIVYNDWITIASIPARAYAYELGSRSAIDWVIDSYRVRTDKASGIRNDPNDWAIEHKDPTYILDLVGRIVTLSMRTLDVVEALPRLVL
jgi:predicted helicase